MTTPTRESIRRLPAYSMGVQSVDNVERIIQLGQNELGLPASPAAAEAVRDLATELPRYASMDHRTLRQANQVFQGLLEVGIIVRPMGSYDLSDCLRVTIGSSEEMGVFWQHLKSITT